MLLLYHRRPAGKTRNFYVGFSFVRKYPDVLFRNVFAFFKQNCFENIRTATKKFLPIVLVNLVVLFYW
jgi:hypothetical protein